MKYDQFALGQVFITRHLTITQQDIVRFADEFDPAYMHLDPIKAEACRFGGLIASGIHIIAVTIKLWVELGFYGDDVIAGTGMDQIRFIKPVYPGDELQARIEVIAMSAKNNESGKIIFLLTTDNQQAETVFSGCLSILFRR